MIQIEQALTHATEVGRRILRQGALDQPTLSALFADYRDALEAGASFAFTRFLVLRHQIDEPTCAWLEQQVPLPGAPGDAPDTHPTVRFDRGVMDRLLGAARPVDLAATPAPQPPRPAPLSRPTAPVTSLWLQSPPLAPQLALLDREVWIGRQTTCDLCMPHPGVSRNHAVVCAYEGTLVVEDHSSYGTFVNGVAITRHALQPGDAIAVGPYVIDLSVEPPAANLDDTRRFRLPGLVGETDAWHGTLQTISVAEILQQIEAQQKSGTLRLPGQGQIAFSAGRPVAAWLGGLEGDFAAFALLRLEAGEFSFVPKVDTDERNLAHASVTALLLDASRRQDEGGGPF